MALALVLRGGPRSLEGFQVLRSRIEQVLIKQRLQHPMLKNAGCLGVARPFSLTPQRQMSAGGHDHTKLWTAERALSLGLLGLIPAAFITPCAALDYSLALALVMHSHWGLEAVVVDYMRPAVVGEVLSKLSMAALYGLSIMTLGGLCYFTYSDVGLTNAIKMLWKL